MNNDALTGKLSQQRHDNLQQSCLIVTTFMCQHESRMALHKTDSTSQQQIYCCQHHRSPSTQFQIGTQHHNNLQHSGANLTTIMSGLQSDWHVATSQKNHVSQVWSTLRSVHSTSPHGSTSHDGREHNQGQLGPPCNFLWVAHHTERASQDKA